MINNIAVCVYGYKSKEMVDSINTLLKNKSGYNNIYLYVIDQHQFNRKDKFNNIFKYRHVFWDNINNPNDYKNNILYNNNCEYFLSIGDGVQLNKNWDQDLINTYNNFDGSIISGNTFVNLFIDRYIIAKKNITINESLETGYIDKNFIFSKTDILQKIGFSKIIKYNGDNEEFSCKAFNIKTKIYCMPSYFYNDNTLDLNNHPYVPFSLYHGYKNIKDILSSSADFLRFHNLNINLLKDFPYSSDDVIYDLNKSFYNKVGGEKFYTTIKEIR